MVNKTFFFNNTQLIMGFTISMTVSYAKILIPLPFVRIYELTKNLRPLFERFNIESTSWY
jgi:hypothetical protein